MKEKLIGFLLRHGEPELNRENCFRSWLDIPLDAEGLKQAEKAASRRGQAEARSNLNKSMRAKRAASSAAVRGILPMIPREPARRAGRAASIRTAASSPGMGEIMKDMEVLRLLKV